ncbi:chemotaxis protein CheW [Rhodophyticola sp. MJ-SS7]|nr:chemotaxis protein CheW [Rhodophyticola sp. MJ-SS7]
MPSGPAQSGYGVFRIGDRLVGVPFGHLAEVCVVPAVSKLMVPDGPLLGAFDLRGTLVPLLDLERLCGVPATHRKVGKAAVLQHEKRITAIALDEIISLTEAHPTETRYGLAPGAAEAPGQGDDALFRKGFVLNGGAVNCLDAAALFARDDVPSIAHTRTAQRSSGSISSRKALIFTAGGAHFGVDAVHVGATVPRKPLDTSEIGGDGGICAGFVEHHGWKVPVVHTTRILGLGRAAAVSEAEIVVLRFPGDRRLGFCVDATERLSSIPAEKTHDASALIAAEGLLPKVYVPSDGTQIFMVSFEALSAREDLLTLAELSAQQVKREAPPPAETGAEDGARRESARYLIFDAGGMMAVPARQIARILPMPSDIVPPGDMAGSVLGFFLTGDRSVPLVALPGAPAGADGTGFVLLIQVEGFQVGFTARRICSMQTSEWRIPDGPPGEDDGDLVQVSDRGETMILPLADLAGRARAMARRAAARAPAA